MEKNKELNADCVIDTLTAGADKPEVKLTEKMQTRLEHMAMSKKEKLSEQYRRKAYEVSPTRKRCQYNSEVIAWNNEIVDAFEAGWNAATSFAALWFAVRY